MASVLVEKKTRDTPSLRKWQIAHTTNMAHNSILKNNGISSVHGSLGTPISGFNSRITSRRFETTWAIVKKPLTRVIKLAERSPRQNREVPRRQRGLPGTVGPPHRPRPMGGPMAGGSKIVGSGTHPDQQPSPSCSIPSRRWVALATLLLVA